jgi:thioredoxin 1
MTQTSASKSVTDLEFEKEVLNSKGLTVVDFWAEWCGPCRQLGPTIDALATEYQGRVDIRKMDVDSNPKTPARYHVRGIPSILFFREGQLVDQIVGAVPKAVLDQAIQKHL